MVRVTQDLGGGARQGSPQAKAASIKSGERERTKLDTGIEKWALIREVLRQRENGLRVREMHDDDLPLWSCETCSRAHVDAL